MKPSLRTLCLSGASAILFSVSAGRLGKRVAEHRSLLSDQLALGWENPALTPFRYSSSLTEASLGGEISEEICGGSFRASTFMLIPNAGITGYVGYTNFRRLRGQLTETSDPETVGPYLSFANGDGTMRGEEYRFGGSYTARLGRWNVGVFGSYDAGLYYRRVDPRPRNVTGKIRVNPAGSFLLDDNYALSAGFIFEKYKQTSAVSFVSELGHNTLYHLTGLGTTYSRFDGQGTSTYYTGYTFGGQLGLLPVRKGVYAFGEYTSTGMENILTDLNKLPMARTRTLQLRGQAGWRGETWLVGATGMWSRRRGTENIFGDAVSGQYPQIGSLTLYSHTRREAGLSGAWGGPRLSLIAEAAWESSFEQYLSPMREMEWQRIRGSVAVRGSLPLPKGGYLGLTLSGLSFSPLSNHIDGIIPVSGDLAPVVDNLLADYSFYSSSRFGGEVEGEGLFPLKEKFMIGFSFSYTRTPRGINDGTIAFQFVF